MKEKISSAIANHTKLKKSEIINLLETPPIKKLGDYSFPCFLLAKKLKKAPKEIASSLASKIQSKEFEKVESKGPYLNFYLNRKSLAQKTLSQILEEKEKYGSSNFGKNKKVVIEMSSPNIAKPFGIGHLRSTIIGNSLSNIASFLNFKTIKINYLGDWGTPFGKIILGYKKFGSKTKFKKDPIKHLLELYVKVNKNHDLNEEAKLWFKKLESGDKEATKIWAEFRELSIKDFEKIYNILNIKFDEITGESFYNEKMKATISELRKKKLLEESNGAQIINLEKYNLGIVLIKKSDQATLYATRDLTAAIHRYKKYKFSKMIYEVGAEQKLHFKQIFKILNLLGYAWSKNCVHIYHGLYLDKSGKKLATRKGRTAFMDDIINETIQLAKKEINKREKLSDKELEKRALKIAIASIIYGDLKNHRTNDIVFDISRFIKFEGNTGPYLLYTYARAKSILKKAKYSPDNSFKIISSNDLEKNLILQLSKFPQEVQNSYKTSSPNLIANYSYQIAQTFNEFYHSNKVINSDTESFRLALVDAFSTVLKNALILLGIDTLENM